MAMTTHLLELLEEIQDIFDVITNSQLVGIGAPHNTYRAQIDRYKADEVYKKLNDAVQKEQVRRLETEQNQISLNHENELLETFENIVIPEVRKTLARGYETYGNIWKTHIHTGDLLEDVKHLIDIHIKARMLEGLIALDYGDVNTFEEKMSSAIGYMCNGITKARYLKKLKEEDNG